MRALVLSGGGAKGAYQAGAIKYLLGDRATHYDIITGVSVGAINAAHLAQFSAGNESDAGMPGDPVATQPGVQTKRKGPLL